MALSGTPIPGTENIQYYLWFNVEDIKGIGNVPDLIIVWDTYNESHNMLKQIAI